MHFDPDLTPDERWENDELQFMRLLGEMRQTIKLTPDQMDTLCESMDLEPDDIEELLDRASDAWDEYKETIP